MLKHLTVALIGILFLFSTSKFEKNKNTVNGIIKPITKRVFTSSNGFCGKSVILNSDFTYCIEGGCENHSSVNLGTWSQILDSVYLNPIDPQSFRFIKKIKISGHKSDSIYFKITDKCGLPVPRFSIISYPYNAGFQLIEKGEFLIKDIDRNKRERDWDNALNSIYSNNIAVKGKDEYIFMNKKGIEYFELGQIYLLSKNRFKIMSNEIEGDTIDIELNINKEAVNYSDLKWFQLDAPIITYYLKDSILSNSDDRLIERLDH